MEAFLYGLFLLGVAFYLYRQYAIRRLIIASVPLLAGFVFIAYGSYLLAVSPYLRPLAFLEFIFVYSLLLSLPAFILSKEPAVKAYAFSISSLIALARYPRPILLSPYDFVALAIEAIVVYFAAIIVRLIIRNEEYPLKIYGFEMFALLIGLFLAEVLPGYGSFKAATLATIPSLDIAATILYGSAFGLVMILIDPDLRMFLGGKLLIVPRELIERYVRFLILSIAIFAALFLIPFPLNFLGLIFFLALLRVPKVPKFRLLTLFTIAIAAAFLVTPNVGAERYNIGVAPRESYPITIDHLRLVDRSLFLDIVTTSVRLNVSTVSVRLVTEAANVGLVDGKPLYIVPFVVTRYSEENNKMLGYVALPLDRPVPEAALVKYVEMPIAPGLLGYRDLAKYIDSLYGPKGYNVTEYYLIDDENYASKLGVENPFRVVLLEKRRHRIYPDIANFVVLVDKAGNVKEAPLSSVPQGISSYTAFKMLEIRGSNERDRKVDYTASGALRIPPSATRLETIAGEFYSRFHHIVIGSTRVRDAYFLIQTANYESTISAVLNGSRISVYDLRGYSFGGSRGVVVPDRVLEAFSKLLSSEGLFNVEVRYPKLYKYGSHLLRISLVIEQRPDADRVRGVVFAEAANTRISGFVEYSYGESLAVFLDRLKKSIDATYAGYTGGSQTQTAFVNGTVIRVGSFLTEYQGSIVEVFVFYVDNGTDTVIFLVHPAYVASLQEYYKASLVKPGDRIYAGLRYVIELQSRCAYEIKLYRFLIA